MWIKRFLITLFVFCLFGLATIYFLVKSAEQQMSLSAQNDAFILQVKKGENAFSLYSTLSTKLNLETNKHLFKLWSRLNRDKVLIKKGVYQIDASTNLASVFQMVSEGKTKQFSVTLVEGYTLKQWYKQLSLTDSLYQDMPAVEVLFSSMSVHSFCKNEHSSLEGCLLPDTYYYSYEDSALSILIRAHDAMKSYIEDTWQQRFQDVLLNTPFEALILASIVEKETGLASERGLIAGVFANRLQKNMRLQTDPTVIYGIGDAFDGNITRKHLRTTTPYNTYRIKGLPITPIAMPSRESIMAALRPALTEYIYFVSKGDGSHQFSETLDEHNTAVRRYQLGRKQ